MMHTLWNFQLLLVSPSIRSNRDHFLQADLSGTYVIVLLSFPLRPNVFDRATSGLHCRWHYWDSPGVQPLSKPVGNRRKNVASVVSYG